MAVVCSGLNIDGDASGSCCLNFQGKRGDARNLLAGGTHLLAQFQEIVGGAGTLPFSDFKGKFVY